MTDRADADAFMAAMERRFGREDVIRKLDPPRPGPPVWAFFWHDCPEPDTTTAVTYGLSAAEHPDWRAGRPELITVTTTACEDFGLCAAYFAAHFRGEKAFTYGSLFTLDSPITDDSSMSGFVLFAPPLAPEVARVELPGRTIHLVGAYPIHRGEAALIQDIGVARFWKLDAFEPYDVLRPDLSRP